MSAPEDQGWLDAEYDSRCDEHCNRRHISHMFEGYRDTVRGSEDARPYPPGSARDVSWSKGRRLAIKDLEESEYLR